MPSSENVRFHIGDFFPQNFSYLVKKTLIQTGNTYTQWDTGVATTDKICKADLPKNHEISTALRLNLRVSYQCSHQ